MVTSAARILIEMHHHQFKNHKEICKFQEAAGLPCVGTGQVAVLSDRVLAEVATSAREVGRLAASDTKG
ncbi:MAG: hypothetical protein A2W18_14765 [Candidatus Muproteobacteria bacterium RBG_16_60_9]|uniref:Uncharacterized protein n=1 Tax=Candidatus Muproteobacteria bacterium RBG_16_60_9 TaxID=1817755 RepID=A0A1F6UWT3_9PROT|nr:MAG: hypothetical protein A2W18_14765 [Candidatus Muproteobacteria bacterium RBG_16_60_9]